MKKTKFRMIAALLLSLVLISSTAVVSFADSDAPEDAKQCWTLGMASNVNGPEEGVQGTNGWYFMYSDQIDLGQGNYFDESKIKECTWANRGSMQLTSEGGSIEYMWVPENYLAEGLTGEALYQPTSDNQEATFNNWIMTTDGTLNPDVETTAVTGFYAWEAPEAGEYKYDVTYAAGGNHCDLGGTRYYYVTDYYIQDGTEYKRTPTQREGGVALSVNTGSSQLDYAECVAMTKEHDELYYGAFNGKVELQKGDKLYFAVDPREVGPYDRANLKITITTGEDCVWASGEGAVTYEWDDSNICTAYRHCTTHNGHVQATSVQGVMTEELTPATCSAAGSGIFVADFEDETLEDQTAERPIAKLEHEVDAWNNAWAENASELTKIVWAEDYSSAQWWSKCSKCGEFIFVEEQGTTAKPAPGSAADCTHGGEAIYVASFYWGWYPVESEPVEVGPLGHSADNAWDNAFAENADELTKYIWSDDMSKCTWQTKCSRCDEMLDVETVSTQKKVVGTVDCVNSESTYYEASFWGGWNVVQSEPDIKPALGHDWGEWTVAEDGTKTRVCSRCGEEDKITKEVPAVTLSANSYKYDGKVHKPAVTVKVKGTELEDSEYTVAYSSGCKNVGKYSVTVTLTGKYIGSKTVNFVINPPATKLSKVSAGKKSFTAKWTKKTTQVTGYQLQYSTSSKFKGAKTVKVKSAKKVKAVVKKLKSKKKYYVRIRTYKTVKNVKYYSTWSAAKKVKVK